MVDIEKLKKKIKFSTILTTGRTGSDYLHACLDNVPSVLTFSGAIFYYKFLKNLKVEINNNNINKVLNLFIKQNKHLFSNDKIENKKINLNLKKYKINFMKIIKKNNMNKINFLLAIYLAYYITNKKKISEIKILVHHSHHVAETEKFIKDFKKVKLLVTIRDPRANLMSGIKNWIKYDPSKENEQHFFFYIKRIRQDLFYGLNVKKKIFIKLEEANEKKIKKKICNFLGILHHKNFNKATILGNPWKGDKLSNFSNHKGTFNNSVKINKWNTFFSDHDKYIFNFIYNKYNIFGYKFKRIDLKSYIYFFLFSIIPLSFERNLFSFKYLLNKEINFKYKILNSYFFLKRILYFYYVFFDTIISSKK